MRRSILVALGLALVGSIGMAVVGRSWANDPPAATATVPSSGASGGDFICGGIGGGGNGASLSADRILTPEMAASPEPNEAITAESEFEGAAVKKINAALESPTEIDVKDTPLSDVVEQLRKRHKIEIQLDAAAFKEAGVATDTPVTKTLKGISLRSTLKLLLDELQLKWVIHNEVVLITSPTKAESYDFMTTTLYPVKNLILLRNEEGKIETDFQPLIDLITNTVSPKTWVDNGGTGSIANFQFQDRCLLVIYQTQEVHEEVAALLAALRRCGGPEPKSEKDLRLPQRPRERFSVPSALPAAHGGTGIRASELKPVPTPLPATTPAPATKPAPATATSGSAAASVPPSSINHVVLPATDGFVRILTQEMAAAPAPKAVVDTDEKAGEPAVTKIKAALLSPTEFQFKDTPLKDVVGFLHDKHDIRIELDVAALKEAGVNLDVPITKSLKGVSLHSALGLLLEELQLKYVIRNEVLLITSPVKAESDEFMTTRIYPVKDLILVLNEDGEIETDFQQLIDMIQNSVDPKAWCDNGGTGLFTPYQLHDRSLLIISQTQEVHEKVASLLAAMRRSGAVDNNGPSPLQLPMRPRSTPLGGLGGMKSFNGTASGGTTGSGGGFF